MKAKIKSPLSGAAIAIAAAGIVACSETPTKEQMTEANKD